MLKQNFSQVARIYEKFRNHSTKSAEVEATDSELSSLSLLLVDDDLVFGKVLQRFARKQNIEVTLCNSVGEFLVDKRPSDYDVVVLDYFLNNNVKGSDLLSSFGHVPLVLTSRSNSWANVNLALPHQSVGFVHKKYGANAILESARKAARHGEEH